MHQSIKSFEFRQLPVFKAAIRQVSSYDKRNLFLTELLLCDCEWIPVHQWVTISGQVKRWVFGDLNCSDTDDSGLFVLGHEWWSYSLSVWLVIDGLFLLDNIVFILWLFLFGDAFKLITILIVSVFITASIFTIEISFIFTLFAVTILLGDVLWIFVIDFDVVLVFHSVLHSIVVVVHLFYIKLKIL